MTMMTFDQLLDLMEQDSRDIDVVLEKQKAFVEKQGDKISCRACPNTEAPGCCYQKVMVYVAEALPIARLLKSQGRDTPAFRAHLLAVGEAMEGTSNDTWFQEDRRPCVFLAEGRCSIYAHRPHACRTYHVISDPVHCQPGGTEGVLFLDWKDLSAHRISNMASAQRALGLGSDTTRIYAGALPRIVRLALIAMDQRTPTALRKVFQREQWPTLAEFGGGSWVNGKNPFAEKLVQIRRRGGS